VRAITLHAPYATLIVTRQPCDCATAPGDPRQRAACQSRQMVKQWETRTRPCPPSIIGQRIVFHQAVREPHLRSRVGDWTISAGRGEMGDRKAVMWHRTDEVSRLLPLGAIVGSGTITESLPIVGVMASTRGSQRRGIVANGARVVAYQSDDVDGMWQETADISDQLPYGDWTPGRWAWRITEAAPTTERCPWCWGEVWRRPLRRSPSCPVCDGPGRCDPIPATGKQGWWTWTP
jgi:hypothetical protein